MAKRATPGPEATQAPADLPQGPEGAQASDDPSPKIVGVTVPWHGRDIAVTIPTPEQLLVLTLIADEFAPGEGGTGPTFTNEDAMTELKRMFNAVTALIVDRADVGFVKDLLVTRKARIEDVTEFFRAALEALAEANPSAPSAVTQPPAGGKRARLVLR